MTLFSFVFAAAFGCGRTPEQRDYSIKGEAFQPKEYGDYEYSRTPKIEGPERLVVESESSDVQPKKTFRIRNTGNDTLELEDWSASPPFKVSIAGASRSTQSLEPDSGLSFQVKLSAEQNRRSQFEGTLQIHSNDPQTPVFEIELVGIDPTPCLRVSNEKLEFGQVYVNQRKSRELILQSCSRRAKTTWQIAEFVGSDAYSIAGEADGGGLDAYQRKPLKILFEPESAGQQLGHVVLKTNDPKKQKVVVQLSGRAKSRQRCPRPRIRASISSGESVTAGAEEKLEAEPLDRVELDASPSFDPQGVSIGRVQWSLLDRPEDSTTRLNSSSGATTNKLFLDLAGEYTIELKVWNEEGLESCGAARLRIQATASSDIHTQLVWDTPADEDETDDSGADVDIHFLHPNGRWNIAPWDTFWDNRNPDWGPPGDRGDPSLDIDDLNGAGPENINLDNPQDGLAYRVGVHYFDPHNYGKSLATVRIFIKGELELELEDKKIRDQEFWHVAKIEWPSEQIEVSDRVHRSFPTLGGRD